MSSPLALGAVSAVLRNLLDNGMVDVGVGSVQVSVVAPDLVKLDDQNAGPRLNLFLYRVSPNPGWRNVGLPSFAADGSRVSTPPLALDLHFLLTAYGVSDFQAEILLGYAMSILHERPVLDRASIRFALDPGLPGTSMLPPEFQALSAADLADQVEAITITFEPMDTEELSRLWSAIQSHYRPSAAYLASVVLIESTRPTRTPLPVLSRGTPDPVTGHEPGVYVQPNLMPPIPTVFRIDAAGRGATAVLGETLRIEGANLDGTSVEIVFAHPLLDDSITVTVGVNAEADAVAVALPSGAAAEKAWPAGLWSVRVTLLREGRVEQTNTAALMLVPQPILAPAPVVSRDGDDLVEVVAKVRPWVLPAQRVTLALGSDVAVAEARTAATNTVTFRYGNLPTGTKRVRLTVDGAESLLVDTSKSPPIFDPLQVVVVPA